MIILNGNINNIKKLFAIYIAVLCYSPNMSANDLVEFNVDVLDVGDRNNIDLTRFSKDNFVFPGTYLLDLYINGQSLSQQKVTYITDPHDSEKSLVCFTPKQIEMLALKEDALKKSKPYPLNVQIFYLFQALKLIIMKANWISLFHRHG